MSTEPIERRSLRARPLPLALLAAARPPQWVKNVLVFAAPGAAGVLDQTGFLLDAVAAFVCFCLAAAGTYFLNDASDVAEDRLHPTKRFRPIAAGEVPVGLARVVGVGCMTAGIGLGAAVRWQLGVVVLAYVLLTSAYTTWLKHVTVVDVVAVAAGFVLRAIGGAAATDVPVSDWFFIVASFGSLFMVTGKRHAESLTLGAEAGSVRRTLEGYTTSYLAYLRSVTSGVVLVAYCLWAFERAELVDGSVPWYQISIVPFACAILRYAQLVDAGEGGAPEELVRRDPMLQVLGASWLATFALGVYVG
ncbi:MAG: decaprenyl-phosphate phosphoribosyltransferase [Acidimicrobiales bacterium]